MTVQELYEAEEKIERYREPEICATCFNCTEHEAYCNDEELRLMLDGFGLDEQQIAAVLDAATIHICYEECTDVDPDHTGCLEWIHDGV